VTATGAGAYKGLAYRYIETEPAASGADVTHTWDLNGWIKMAG